MVKMVTFTLYIHVFYHTKNELKKKVEESYDWRIPVLKRLKIQSMMTHVDLDLSNKQTCDWLKLLKKKKTSALQP